MGKFIDMLGDQATGGIGSAIGAGMGLLLGNINDERQYEQQRRLQDMQIVGQKQMTDYNMRKQLDMWHNTGYGPQMQQLKNAGLNPALIYGMKGGGAQTTGNASGTVTGATAHQNPGELTAMAGMGMQMQLLRAQKENIEADTANKQKDTVLKDQTQWKIGLEAAMMNVLQSTTPEGKDTNNAEETIAFKQALAQLALTQGQTQLNDTQAKSIIEQIQQGWKKLEQGKTQLEQEAIRIEIEKEFKESLIQLGWAEIIAGTATKILSAALTKGTTTITK